MAKVRLLGGKPLMVGGKVALNNNCCCGGGGECACSLPGGDCPHALCCEFNPDGPMVDGYWDNGEILGVGATYPTGGGLAFFPYFYDDGAGNTFAGMCIDHSGAVVSGDDCWEVAMDSADFFGAWHAASAQITANNDGTLNVTWCAYAITKSFIFTPASAVVNANQLFVGCSFPSNDQAISIRSIKFLPDFSFPSDSFDTTIGSGQSIVGSDTVRIDNSSGTNGYIKEGIGANLLCYGGCCIDCDCSFKPEQDCLDAGGIYLGDNTYCGIDSCSMGCLPALSSGTLTIGVTYQISTYNSGDDFTNVGAGSNMTGEIFVATGSTPSVWTNLSVLVIYQIYLNVAGVSMCPCITDDTPNYSVHDGHPLDLDCSGPGINSQWILTYSFLNHYQCFTGFCVDTDPYFFIKTHSGAICSGDETIDIDECIANASCLGDIWTVDLSHGGFASAFTGSSACGSVILNSYATSGDCTRTTTPDQIGYGGYIWISLTP